jgi:hypothetical protein
VTLLLGTGPLVTVINRSDGHHDRCTAPLEPAEGPLLIPATLRSVTHLQGSCARTRCSGRLVAVRARYGRCPGQGIVWRRAGLAGSRSGARDAGPGAVVGARVADEGSAVQDAAVQDAGGARTPP